MALLKPVECLSIAPSAAPHAAAEAERAEVLHEPELDFGCTILVLGLQVCGYLVGVA